jgi:hypothetical protein
MVVLGGGDVSNERGTPVHQVFLASGQGVIIPAGGLAASIAVSVSVNSNPPPVAADKADVMTSVSDVITPKP